MEIVRIGRGGFKGNDRRLEPALLLAEASTLEKDEKTCSLSPSGYPRRLSCLRGGKMLSENRGSRKSKLNKRTPTKSSVHVTIPTSSVSDIVKAHVGTANFWCHRSFNRRGTAEKKG